MINLKLCFVITKILFTIAQILFCNYHDLSNLITNHILIIVENILSKHAQIDSCNYYFHSKVILYHWDILTSFYLFVKHYQINYFHFVLAVIFIPLIYHSQLLVTIAFSLSLIINHYLFSEILSALVFDFAIIHFRFISFNL